jgi:hypothetical protein
MGFEFDKQTLEGLTKIKMKHSLVEIAILTNSGKLVATTQMGQFNADESLYAIIGVAANQVSQLNGENMRGITLETDKSEYFLHPALTATKLNKQIVALQYPHGAIENGKRKEIVKEVSQLCY